jgi:hypothetical protein
VLKSRVSNNRCVNFVRFYRGGDCMLWCWEVQWRILLPTKSKSMFESRGILVLGFIPPNSGGFEAGSSNPLRRSTKICSPYKLLSVSHCLGTFFKLVLGASLYCFLSSLSFSFVFFFFFSLYDCVRTMLVLQ